MPSTSSGSTPASASARRIACAAISWCVRPLARLWSASPTPAIATSPSIASRGAASPQPAPPEPAPPANAVTASPPRGRDPGGVADAHAARRGEGGEGLADRGCRAPVDGRVGAGLAQRRAHRPHLQHELDRAVEAALRAERELALVGLEGELREARRRED